MDHRHGGRRGAPATRFASAVRGLTALAAFAALSLAHPRAAAAHTHLRESHPGAGETVAADVREVRLRFSEGVEPGFTSVTLAGPDGATATVGALNFPTDGGGRVAVLPLTAPLAPGRWTVSWKTAAADGHPAKGSFSFVVRAPSPDSATASAPVASSSSSQAGTQASDRRPTAHADSTAMGSMDGMTGHDMAVNAQPGGETESMHHDTPVDVAIRWLGLLALLAMVGSVAFHFAVAAPVRSRARELAPEVDRRAAGVGTAALVLSIPLVLLRLWSESRAMSGADRAMDPGALAKLVGGTAWGHAWLLQAAATVLFAVGILLARRGRGGGWALAGLAALALAGVPALSGHAAASDNAVAAVAVDWVHVLAAAAWLGSLLTLLAAGIPACLRRPVGEGAGGLALLVGRFSPFALGAACVAALTGVVSATLRLSALPQLWTTEYGRALLVKLALVAVVAAIGAFNWRVVRPSLGTGVAAARLRRTATAEIVVGALVVLATAVLVALPTP